MAAPAIEIENLGVTFHTPRGPVYAVSDVSFAVEPGQALGVVGESGSGKSVTGFSVIGLVDAPGEVVGGSVRFRGRELVGLAEEEMPTIGFTHRSTMPLFSIYGTSPTPPPPADIPTRYSSTATVRSTDTGIYVASLGRSRWRYGMT